MLRTHRECVVDQIMRACLDMLCDVMPSNALSQGLSPDRGGDFRDRPFPIWKETIFPTLVLEQVLIIYLSLGLEDGSLGGQQLGRYVSGKEGQSQRKMEARSADVSESAAASPESGPST